MNNLPKKKTRDTMGMKRSVSKKKLKRETNKKTRTLKIKAARKAKAQRQQAG